MRLKKTIATMAVAGSLMALPASAFAGSHGSIGGGGGGSLVNVSHVVDLGNVQACGILTILSGTGCKQTNN